MWIPGVIAAVSAIGSAVSGAKGQQASSHAEHAQSKAIKRSWIEDYRSMHMEEQATLGTQAARYAASGVDVGVGSVAKVMQETRDEFHRSVAAEAYLTQQRLKGASLEAKTAKYAQVGNYFSNAADLASGVQDFWKNRPGQT